MNKVMFRTYSPKQSEIKPNWILVDVKGKTLGRISTKIADVLRGKNKPTYSGHIECGDYVVVINAAEIKLTGKKLTDKTYNWHTRYPNGLKETTPKKLMEKNQSEKILLHSISGMIPNNKHKKTILKRLKIFAGSEHNLQAQNPSLTNL